MEPTLAAWRKGTVASLPSENRFISVPRSKPADQMEAMLRQADASLEKWFRGAKQRGAGILRQRVDDVQTGLKKLSAGLEQVERKRGVNPSASSSREQTVTPRKRRARAATPRKPSALKKPRKAA